MKEQKRPWSQAMASTGMVKQTFMDPSPDFQELGFFPTPVVSKYSYLDLRQPLTSRSGLNS
jgi:hypothetical protein